jgi:hypothetical protein
MKHLRHLYCRNCGRTTPQLLLSSVNGDRLNHEYWRCGACNLTLLTIENIADVEGLCDKLVASLARQLVGEGRHDWDDARLFLREQAWIAYSDWRPERAASFLAFASERLRLRLLDWIRRNTPDQFLYAASLDSPAHGGRSRPEDYDSSSDRHGVDSIRVSVGRIARDDHDDSLADLRRAVVQRGRRGA